MKSAFQLLAVAGLAVSSAFGAGQAVDSTGVAISMDPGASTAVAAYPGARALVEDGVVVTVFGVPMNGGATMQDSAASFWKKHGVDFGVVEPDLHETRATTLSNGSTAIAYEQHLAGLPVDRGIARLVVHPDGNHVTYATARFAKEPAGGFEGINLTGAQAIATVSEVGSYSAMGEWSDASLVIHDTGLGGGESNAKIAWKFSGRGGTGENPRAFTFFVDAANGGLLEVRNMILNVDIAGNAKALGTPGVKPDSGSNAPVQMPLPLIRVKGPATVESNMLGDFLMTYGGTTAVNLSISLNDGKWARVIDRSNTSILSQTVNATPPGPANFLLNTAPAQYTTAQVNAFIGTIEIHEYFKSRAPEFTGLDIQMPANVNWNEACNAYFDGSSINFFRINGGCVNSAYSTIVAHEYGHFVVQQLGLAQNAFGEGFGDTCAILLYDSGIIGQDFCGTGCHIRNIDAANKQYPCGGAIHDCGQVLGGVWRDLRLKLGEVYGSEGGLEIARQLHVDWAMITIGEQNGSNAAWPQTGIEAMTVDDNDGNLLNGTPNYPSLNYAFGKHGIALPVIKPVSFLYPSGLPSTASGNVPIPLTVQVVDGSETSVPETAVVEYRLGSVGAFSSKPMTPGENGVYTVSLPRIECGETVEYRFGIATTETPAGFVDPATSAHSVMVVSGGTPVLSESFEGSHGFTVSGAISLGAAGRWVAVDPNPAFDGDGVQTAPGDDTTGGTGTKCFVTGANATTGAATANDVDGIETILTSPVFSIDSLDNPAISYFRWFYNNDAADPDNYLITEISNNGGTNWTLVEKLQVGSGGWQYREFDPTDYVAATANMRVRFRAGDKLPDDIVEAGIDDFRVFSATCACPSDFDGTGFVDSDDFDAFVTAFEAGLDSADFDGTGFVDSDDFDAFVAAFEAGC